MGLLFWALCQKKSPFHRSKRTGSGFFLSFALKLLAVKQLVEKKGLTMPINPIFIVQIY
jgi:hypothetical protein